MTKATILIEVDDKGMATVQTKGLNVIQATSLMASMIVSGLSKCEISEEDPKKVVVPKMRLVKPN